MDGKSPHLREKTKKKIAIFLIILILALVFLSIIIICCLKKRIKTMIDKNDEKYIEISDEFRGSNPTEQ